VHRAVNLLRAKALSSAYDEAFAEWERTDDSHLWEQTAGDPPGELSAAR